MSNEKGSVEKKTCKEMRTLSTSDAFAYNSIYAVENAMLVIAGGFTLFFYVNIMGQQPFVIGLIYSGALYLFAILSPFFGALSDRISSRFGRKKTMIVMFGPLVAIAFFLIWIPPVPPQSAQYGALFVPILIWFLILSLLWRISESAYYAGWTALLPEISTDEQNRIKIGMIGGLLSFIATILALLGPLLMFGNATETLSREDPNFFIVNSNPGRLIYSQLFIFSIFLSIAFIMAVIVFTYKIKEPPQTSQKSDSWKLFLQDLSVPFKDKTYKRWMLTFFLVWTASTALDYLLMNLAAFVLELRGLFEIGIFVGIVFSFGLLSFFFWKAICNKLGLKRTVTLCFVVMCVSYILMSVIALPLELRVLQIFGLIIYTLCLIGKIGIIEFAAAIGGDIIDSAELESGKSVSGSYTGAGSLIGSLAGATSMIIITIFLQMFGSQSKMSYAIIFIVGALLFGLGAILFQKVSIVGTERRKINSN